MNFGIFQAEKLVTGAIRAKRLSSSAALNPSRSLGCQTKRFMRAEIRNARKGMAVWNAIRVVALAELLPTKE